MSSFAFTWAAKSEQFMAERVTERSTKHVLLNLTPHQSCSCLWCKFSMQKLLGFTSPFQATWMLQATPGKVLDKHQTSVKLRVSPQIQDVVRCGFKYTSWGGQTPPVLHQSFQTSTSGCPCPLHTPPGIFAAFQAAGMALARWAQEHLSPNATQDWAPGLGSSQSVLAVRNWVPTRQLLKKA